MTQNSILLAKLTKNRLPLYVHLKKNFTKKIGKRQLKEQASAEIASSSVNDGSTVLQDLLNRMSQQKESISSLYSENARLNRSIAYMEMEMAELKRENSYLKKGSLYTRKSPMVSMMTICHRLRMPRKKTVITAAFPLQGNIRSLPQCAGPVPSEKVQAGRSAASQVTKGTLLRHVRILTRPRTLFLTSAQIAKEVWPMSLESGVVKETRQVIDIVLPSPFVTNCNIIGNVCECRHKVCGEFPDREESPVSYSLNLMCMVVFLVEAQHIPTGRVVDIFRQWFGLSVSEGTACYFIRQIRNLAMPAYEEIRRRVSQAPVAGADETGEDICRRPWWLWG